MGEKMNRIENDFYPTPSAITEALLDSVKIGGVIFEPCNGSAAITQVILSKTKSLIYTSDLTYDDSFERDATKRSFWTEWTDFIEDDGLILEWTVTNPPFSVAEKILPLAWEHSSKGIAMLLRLSYLEPTKNRADWLKENADHLKMIIPVNPRVRFRSDVKGTDSVTCAWFIWEKSHSWKSLGIDCPFQFLAGWKK